MMGWGLLVQHRNETTPPGVAIFKISYQEDISNTAEEDCNNEWQ